MENTPRYNTYTSPYVNSLRKRNLVLTLATSVLALALLVVSGAMLITHSTPSEPLAPKEPCVCKCLSPTPEHTRGLHEEETENYDGKDTRGDIERLKESLREGGKAGADVTRKKLHELGKWLVDATGEDGGR